MKTQKVQKIDAFDPNHFATNVNLFRQRELSYPQKVLLKTVAQIATGDLETIKKAIKTSPCKVSQGVYEVDESEKKGWYEARAIRITSNSKKNKKPWCELIYDDPNDAKTILSLA